MKDKLVLITGASSGIGFQTAKDLAQMGAQVILIGRSEEKLRQAIADIKAATGNDKLSYYTADLSSQKSIRAMAEKVKRDHDKIDVLINNAGGTFSDFKLTEDGLERTIATNHFAYFLLTNLLLDLVKKSDYARIVNVASGSHYQGKIDFESFTKDMGHFVTKAYAQSKLANVLFTFELADRLQGTNVTVNCLHPGMVNTEIGNKDTNNWYASLFWTLASRTLGISLEKGAKTSVYLASSPEVKGVTAKYFDKCKVKEPAKLAKDKALGKQLWEVSEKLCPIN